MQSATTAAISFADTSWLLFSSCLVFLMTPALGFFYAGLVRSKHVVSTMMQSLTAIAVVGIIWIVLGYSLAFSGDHFGLIGNLQWFMLTGVGQAPHASFAPTVPHLLFMAFQMMFAIITPTLITGAFAERVDFRSWLIFMALWSLAIYCPVAHWVWGQGGWIAKMGGLDFAGGLVVHMTSGYAALMAAALCGRRSDYGTKTHSYNLAMVFLGTALLFFGWFGFNAGSALNASGLAAHSYVTTFIGGATGLLAWLAVDLIKVGRASASGLCVGVLAGLVAITPAAGFVSVSSAMIIGGAAGVACNYAVWMFKTRLKVDDTLDVFACHGVGGTVGALLTGVFSSSAVNPAATDGLIFGNFSVLKANAIGSLAVILFSLLGTAAIYYLTNWLLPFRVCAKTEQEGLDITQHGEQVLVLNT